MNVEDATELVRHALLMTLLISAPILMIGLVVGIVISLLQALTQIQEQTLTFVPKIVAMIAVTVALLPWVGRHLMEYTSTLFMSTALP
jgi:flagellar biosynthesis protein FliQ